VEEPATTVITITTNTASLEPVSLAQEERGVMDTIKTRMTGTNRAATATTALVTIVSFLKHAVLIDKFCHFNKECSRRPLTLARLIVNTYS
jgi:hypothetical protein